MLVSFACVHVCSYFWLVLVFFCLIINPINGQAPYEYGNAIRATDDILDPFAQSSLENIQMFKTKVFKLIEAQNHYFELIQQKRPAIGDYEYVKFDVLLPGPDYDLKLMDNQRLIVVPKPNVPSNYTQLLLSIDDKSQLNLWQFVSDATIIRVTQYRLGQTIITNGFSGSNVKCIKIKSFVSKTGLHRFRLQAVALFSTISSNDNDQYSSGTDFILVLAINLMIQESNVILQTDFIEEQVIKFEKIPDFDLIFVSNHRVYLSLIQNSEDSNFKYELSLYQLINGKLFDKIAWQRSDFILNAKHVKLALLDSRLYLICSYDMMSSQYYYDDQSSTSYLNVFQLVENVKQAELGNKLIFVSSVNNFTATTAKEIHHLSGNNDFFFLVKEDDIDVYWFDGHSLIYYDTVVENRSLSFALEKIPDQPPLILSTDGQNLNLYYKVYSKFVHHQLDLLFNDEYRLEQVEIFTFNRQYYVWFKFGRLDLGFDEENSPKQYYCQFARVQSRKPETNEEMYNLDTCLMDLRDRIEGGLREVKTLKRKSEELLVISAAEPILDVDVIVHDTFRTERARPESFTLRVPGKVVKGDSVMIFVETVGGRVDHLENRINTTVLLRSGSNQTISSPIEFLHPVTTESLWISSVEKHFYLNDINFETYASDSLTWNTEQTISSSFAFLYGLQVDQMMVNQINGIDMKYAMSINETAPTQLVTQSKHRYHNLELLNGTTVPRINDVELVDLFQDRPNPIQMIRGQKTFANLSVQEIAVDTLFNDMNLGSFIEQIVWLENEKIPMQKLTGEWQFNDRSTIKNLTLINRINEKIDFDDFVNNTAKKDAESIIIESPVNFKSLVHVNLNLNVTGLINDLKLREDIVLTRENQDFTKKYLQTEPIVFESRTTRFTNLTIEVLNDRFRPKDFLLRKADGGDDSSKFILRNKYFQNDLIVRGHVNLRPQTRMNQVQVRELFYKLDTMVSLSTPVTVEEIVVEGDMETDRFNDMDSFYVQQRIRNLLLRDIPQTFNMPLSYYGSLEISNFSFDQFINNLKFPEHFVPRHNQSEEIIFTGRKYFESPVKVQNNIYLGPNGSVNGGRINQVFATMVRLNHQKQKIGGRKTFLSLIVKGDVHIRNNRINGNLLNETISINSPDEQVIRMPMVFNSIIVDYDDFEIQEMSIGRGINGINYRKFWLDAVPQPSEQFPVLELYNKHFPKGLYVNHILINGTINDIDLSNLMQNALTVDTRQNVSASIFFKNATFDDIVAFETINGLDRNYFQNVVRKDSQMVDFETGPVLESVLGYWYVEELHVKNSLNGYNITDIYHRVLKRESVSEQIIKAKHVYLKPIQIQNLGLSIERTVINQVPIRSYVWLNSPNLVFNADVVFENLKQIGNLSVYGLINQCSLDEMAATSVRHDNQSPAMFNLTGKYILPRILIKGNVGFHSTINQEPNFLGKLVQTHDPRPLRSNVYFLNDITVKKIYINNLINRRNLSMLLNDAVYLHRPQHIVGAKTFRKPLKIIGNINQLEGGEFVVKNRFNDHNLTDLFESTIKIDDRRPILGKKMFTGNITFGRSVHLGHGFNGLRFPQDYVLTYTNETIYGQTNFQKRVRIHRNLNVQLINHINITRFVHNAIMINETQPKQVSTTVRFKNPIKILNLTIHHNINDIKVDDLITAKPNNDVHSSPLQIPGAKIFKDDLMIEGDLNVRSNTINDVDIVRDIETQWIDRRRTADGLVNVTGRLIFDGLIHVDSMKIESSLNGLPVKQFNQQLVKMEKDIDHYKRTVQRSLNEAKRNERIIVENYTSNILVDLKYFRLQQVLPISFENLIPINGEKNGGHFAKVLIGQTGTNNHCHLYQSRNFFLDSAGYAREYPMPRMWRNSSMMIDQNDDFLVLITGNVSNCDEYPLNYHYSVRFWQSFEFLTIFDGESEDLEQPEKTYPLNLDGNHIETIKLFHTAENSDYLLVHYRSKTSNVGILKLFKHFNQRLEDLKNAFNLEGSMSVLSFDLFESEDLVWLSVLGDLIENGFANYTTRLFYWNRKSETFRPEHLIFTNYEPYSLTKLISIEDHFLIVYARSDHYRCEHDFGRWMVKANEIDLFELVKGNVSTLQPYQTILTRLNKIMGIQWIKIHPTITYLLTYSSSAVELFQHRGYNRFESISFFRFDGRINNIQHYWINGERLFLAVAGGSGNSWILSTLISGQSDRTMVEKKNRTNF